MHGFLVLKTTTTHCTFFVQVSCTKEYKISSRKLISNIYRQDPKSDQLSLWGFLQEWLQLHQRKITGTGVPNLFFPPAKEMKIMVKYHFRLSNRDIPKILVHSAECSEMSTLMNGQWSCNISTTCWENNLAVCIITLKWVSWQNG